MISDKDPHNGSVVPNGTAQRQRLSSSPSGHMTLAFSLMPSPLFATCSPLTTPSHAIPIPRSPYATVTLPTAHRPHFVFCAQPSTFLQSLSSSERSSEASFEPLRSRFFLGPRSLRQPLRDTHMFIPQGPTLLATTATVEEKVQDVPSPPSPRGASPNSSSRKTAAAGIRSLDPATREWNHKLNGLRNARSFDQVEEAWEQMDGRGIAKDVVSYTSMVNAAIKFRRYDRAEELLQEAVAKGLVDPFLITAAMSLFARRGDAGAAIAFWEEVQAAKLKPGTIAWAAYLNAVKEGADFQAVEAVWRAMVRRQMHKSVSAYTCMIGAAIKFGHYDRAEKVLQDMRKKGIAPNAYTATVVLDLYSKRGDPHAARAFWASLADVDPKVDLGVHQWTSYLNAVTSRPPSPPKSSSGGTPRPGPKTAPPRPGGPESDSDLDSSFALAERVWEEMAAAGVEANVATYTVMIGAAVRHGRHDAARRILDEMRAKGVAPTPMAATAVLHMFAKTGDVPSACEYIQEMDRSGVLLGSIPWTVYLAAVADTYAATDFTPVRQCWQEMRRRGVEPTASLYAVMVGAALRANELDEAERLFDEMSRRNVRMNAVLLTHRLSLFSRRRDVTGATEYWSCLLRSDPGSEILDARGPVPVALGPIHWTTFLSVLAEGGDFEHVESCWAEMERRKVERNASSYSCMIGACCRFNRLDVAEALVREVRRSSKKIGLSPMLVTSAMGYYTKKRDAAGARKFWNEARKAGIELGVIPWTAYLGALAEAAPVTSAAGFEHVWATWEEMGEAGVEPNCTTYAVVMSAALRHQLPHRCVQLNEQMKEKGVSLTPATLHLMLQAYAKLREPEQARRLWDEAIRMNVQINAAHSAAYLAALAEGDDYDAVEGVWKRLDSGEGGVNKLERTDRIEKTPAAYCAMVSAAVKFGRMDVVDKLLLEMKERDISPDGAMAKETVAAYARRDVDVAGTLWDVLRESGVGMDADDWASYITALAHGGEFSVLEARWKEMEGKRVKKNAAVYTAMISAAVKFQRWDRANALVDDMRAQSVAPDSNSVTTILMLYGRTGDVEAARRFWKALDDGGVAFSVVHWTSYLNALAEGGEFEEVERVWRDMDRAGIRKNVASYTAMLGAAVKAQRWGRAGEVVEEMRKRQLAPGTRTVTTMLNMYTKTHDVEAAKRLWEEANRAHVQLDVIPWTAYIASLAEGAEFEPVWACWQQMEEKGVAKNVATYTVMIRAAIKFGRLSVADALIREMNKKKILPSALTITTILGLYRKRRDIEGARRFWAELERPNLLQVEKNSRVHLGTIHWTAYLNTMAEGKDFALVEECWRDMGLRRIERNVATYTAMIGAAVKFKQLQRAEELLAEMNRLNIHMNPATLTNVLNLYGKLKDVDSAQRFWAGLQQQRARGEVGVITWTAYLNAVSSDKGHFHLAEECWKEMDENGVKKNVATYTAMIAAAIRCNRLPRAEELVREMRERGIEPDAMAARTVLGMYAKTRDAEAARTFWNDMSKANLKPDALHWSAYLTAVSGDSHERT